MQADFLVNRRAVLPPVAGMSVSRGMWKKGDDRRDLDCYTRWSWYNGVWVRELGDGGSPSKGASKY